MRYAGLSIVLRYFIQYAVDKTDYYNIVVKGGCKLNIFANNNFFIRIKAPCKLVDSRP